MALYVEWLAAALVLVASLLLLLAAIGLVRLPDFYMRLHAPSLLSTLGLGGMLLASMLYAAALGHPSFAELLITLLVFVSSPISANVLAQAALHSQAFSRAALPAQLQPQHWQ
jgi:multicomponent K+:H+ antiporter subunit G